MSGHLGPAVTALVDGELDHERREQVLAHLAHCSPCRVEVEVLRTVKATLRRAEPALPTGLAQRLAAAAGTEPVPAHPGLRSPAGHRWRPGAKRRAPIGRTPIRRTPIRRTPIRRTPIRRAVVGGAAVALGLAGAVLLAGPPPRAPIAPVDPTSTQLLVDHRSTGSEMPFADVGVTTASLR